MWGRRKRRGYRAGEILRRHELSIVACDLRGYTRFSSTVAPEDVVELLAEYYAAIEETVAAFRGSIKDHAGDGTLVLVGALRPSRDHAERAVAMALAIGLRSEELFGGWRLGGIEIGLGIGVASGEVLLGQIRTDSRVERVAVGASVNLAARLCARAAAGQVLVAERTVELLRDDARGRIERLEAAELKGFAQPIPIFHARFASVDGA
jgi:adenylate cyclase